MKWLFLMLGLVIGATLASLDVVIDSFPLGWRPALAAANDASQVLILFLAFGALLYAGRQVGAARDSNETAIRLARAQFLLDLDHRWASSEMQEARTVFKEIHDEVEAEVAVAPPRRLDDATTAQAVGIAFGRRLDEMREGPAPEYAILMRVCGFF